MCNNKLIIAAAGSGKTTFLINEALKIKDDKVIITTYTQANEEEIKKKIIEINNCIPENITIQTWFSFLIQNGIKPYQGSIFEKEITGMILVSSQSGFRYYNNGRPTYWGEDNLEKYYFTSTNKIYSDKLSKLVVRCNDKSNGEVINRLVRIYKYIFVDEVQDLAGYDLEFIKLLFQSSAKIILVGDPRQVTYLTHHEKKYLQYKYGLIKEFIINECKRIDYEIDETTLNTSYRNNAMICSFSSKLYAEYPPCNSSQTTTTNHDGVFLVRIVDVDNYLETYKPMQLRFDRRTKGINQNYPVMNFGISKGLSFDRVLIYPTKSIETYLVNGILKVLLKKKKKTDPDEMEDAFDIAKFYVAVTRARYSVGIVCNYNDETFIAGLSKYKPDENQTEQIF